jgi:hypothetical protein
VKLFEPRLTAMKSDFLDLYADFSIGSFGPVTATALSTRAGLNCSARWYVCQWLI